MWAKQFPLVLYSPVAWFDSGSEMRGCYMTVSSAPLVIFYLFIYWCILHMQTAHAGNAQCPVALAVLNVNKCLWSRKMSFAQ